MAKKKKQGNETAKYNFIPISDCVYMPDWADLISHDYPFTDGLSGKIDYTLKTKSIMYVPEQKEESIENFAIAGSNIKGMLRNVLEIVGFCKFSFINEFYEVKKSKTNEVIRQSYIENIEKSSLRHTKSSVFDLAEIMFGTIRDKTSNLSCKSRVFFNDAIPVKQDIFEEPTQQKTLLSPNGGTVKKYLNKDQIIQGYKYYKLQVEQTESKNSKKNKKTASTLSVIKKEKEFNGTIIFHNLKPVELGALLWIMQLEKNSVHRLGQAKSLGVGAVKISIADRKFVDNQGQEYELTALVNLFKSHMSSIVRTKWENTEQVKTFLELSQFEENNVKSNNYQKIHEKCCNREMKTRIAEIINQLK